jgi:thioredoxin-like negative regulator of GroEL
MASRGSTLGRGARKQHLALALFVGFLLTGRSLLNAVPPVGWSTNLTSTLSMTVTNRRPVLVYFTADWCAPCRQMARTTLQETNVLDALKGFACVAVDVDVNAETAAERSVQAVPTFQILSASGTELRRTTGYQEASRFEEWLHAGMARFREDQARQQRVAGQFKRIDSLLAEGSPNALTEGVATLFDLCASRETEIQQAAAAKLGVLGARDTVLLLPGLNHARLATRIQVANVLRDQLGDGFDFDPWEGNEERRAAVARWERELRQ